MLPNGRGRRKGGKKTAHPTTRCASSRAQPSQAPGRRTGSGPPTSLTGVTETTEIVPYAGGCRATRLSVRWRMLPDSRRRSRERSPGGRTRIQWPTSTGGWSERRCLCLTREQGFRLPLAASRLPLLLCACAPRGSSQHRHPTSSPPEEVEAVASVSSLAGEPPLLRFCSWL